jgi:Aerotolerance regulator N-terminal/von Willebrand factor type A domain
MFGVAFLSPLFLLGALAIAVPIALHLFHRRTEVVIYFPAVRLLKRAPVEQHRRRRVRELILLALRITAVLLLAVSFARPYLAGAVVPISSPLTVIAVDTSFSLSAPGQIAKARAAALSAVDAAPASHAMALVSFSDEATVVVAPTPDRRAVVAGIDRLAAGFGGTRYRTALAKAAELIGVRDGHVTIVTDLQQVGWDANDEGGLPDGVTADVAPVAGPRANLAVTAAERRDRTIVATIQNYGSEAAKTQVTLRMDGKSLATAEAAIAPQSATDVRLNVELPESGAAEVTIDDPTGYLADNVRHFVIDAPDALPITVIVADPAGTTGGIYMERALSVAGSGREFAVDAVDGRIFSAWSSETVARRAALIVIGTRTLDRHGRDLVKAYISRGGQALVTLGPDVDPGTLADLVGIDLGVTPAPVRPAAGSATMVASDARHPIFRPFLNPSGALGDVLVEQYRRLKDQAGRVVLARFSGGDTALAEQTVGQGRVLVFTSDLDNQWSRFPLNAAFVPFAVETARYLTAGRRQAQSWVLPDVPAGTPHVPGVITTGEGAGKRRVAVNVDTRESSPAVTSRDEFAAGIERVSRSGARDAAADARSVEERQRWWQMGLLVMLAALAGEALVGRHTT